MKISRDNNHNVSYTLETNDTYAQQIIDYWTPEKKAAAIPIMQGIPCLEGELEQTKTKTTDPEKADLSKMPFSAGGKLFFSRDGHNYVASANIMEKNNLLVTAAHCFQDRDTGNLCDNFLFERWDYAMAVLNSNSTVTAPLKYSTEDITNKSVTDFGYPVNYYDGQHMVFVKGNAVKCSDNTWIINGCKMRGGSSGGAWVLEDNKTIVGVNSYGPISEQYAYEGSPIFDENFESLYNYVLTLI